MQEISAESAAPPTPVWAGITPSTEGPHRTERQTQGKFFLFLSWDVPLLLPYDMGSPVLWPLDSGITPVTPTPSVWFHTESQHRLSWFCSLQTADCGGLSAPTPHEPTPVINLF